MPGLGFLRQVRHGGGVARERRAGAAQRARLVLVYPGGDWEVHRPTWRAARVDFAGRKGFIRLALDHDVPIVPVVSIGGQETALFLTRGERLAKRLMLDRLFRLKVLPISLALPWGLNVGDFLGHVPLPAKITIEVLPPIDLRERVRGGARRRRGLRPRDAAHAGHPRRAVGRAPAARHRMMRVEAQIDVDAPPEAVWEFDRRPRAATCTSCRASRAGRSAATQPTRPRRALPDAHARRVGRGRRPRRGRRVRRAGATWPGRRSPASTSAAAGGCARARQPGRAHARRVPALLRRRGRGALRLGWPSASRPAPSAAHLRRSLQQLKRAGRARAAARDAAARRKARPGAAAQPRLTGPPAHPQSPEAAPRSTSSSSTTTRRCARCSRARSTREGHRITAVADGDAALDERERGAFDVVLLDVALGPGPPATTSAGRCARAATSRRSSCSPPWTARPTPSRAWRPAPTTTSPSRSGWPSCAAASARCCAAPGRARSDDGR